MNALSTRTLVRVQFYDTDCMGIVHNIAYLRFIEAARGDLIDAMGATVEEMQTTSCYPAIARTEVLYKATGSIGDRLVVTSRVKTVERARMILEFVVSKAADDVVLVTSEQTVVWMRIPSRRPTRIPASIMARVNPEEVAVAA